MSRWLLFAGAALTAAYALSSIAGAADLGGNCCADLEERIAELEATTARKGNRKVSLEVYGQVNEGVLFWDDGGESNTYLVTNDNARTRIGFRGKAKINADWEAGYRLEIGVRTTNSKRFDQDDAGAAADSGFDLRDSNWYLKSKSLGTVYVGLGTTATNTITEINLSQTANFSKYSDVEDSGLGLRLRSAENGQLSALSWRRLLGDGGDQPGEGERALNNIRYETPVWNGFTASTSWGEDDLWDVALRYTGEAAGFKYSAGIGYGEITDNGQTQSVCPSAPAGNGADGSDTRCHQFGGSLSVMHDATGLFINVAAGTKSDDILNQTVRFAGTGAGDSQDFWAVQAGIEDKFSSLGKTTIYGEYYDYSGGANQRRTIDGADGGAADALNPFAAGGDSAIWSTGLNMYGVGIAQGIDAAAMILYVSYRHYEADLTLRQIAGGAAAGPLADVALEDLDVVLGGGFIKF
jgi:Gram-negative porin